MSPQAKIEMLAGVSLQRMFDLCNDVSISLGPLVARGFIDHDLVIQIVDLHNRIMAEANRRGLSLEGDLHGQN